MNFRGKEKIRGITLIALIITIIVMLILAGVSINAIVGDNGIVTKSMEASFKSLMAQYKEDTDTYVLDKQMDSEDYSDNLIFANDASNTFFDNQWVNINALYDYTLVCDQMSNVTTIENETYKSHLSVYEGSLTWFTSYDDVESNEVKWCIDLDIRVFIDGYGFYIQKDDGSYGFEVYSDGEYAQSEDGTWMCTPDLDGFNTASTYYLLYDSVENENPTVGNAIYQDVPSGWYSYSNKKWANVATVSNAHMAYLVWIPRYVYRISGGTVDIKFVNKENVYIDETGNETTPILEGYTLPDAFTFGGEELAGIWVTKYEISDPREPTGFSATTDSSSVTVTSITWNGSSSSTSETSVVEDANVKVTISGDNYTNSYEGKLPCTFEDLNKNSTYTLTVTTPTYYSEDMTLTKTVKTTEGTVAELTSPDLSGFNLDKTYFVTMDGTTPTVHSNKITTESDSIYNDKEIATNAPDGWYDYSARNWANVVTIGDEGSAAYWVWIPRYEYKVDVSQNAVDIVFISANQTEADEGYTIPDAFEFGGVQLSGIWCSKYEISDIKIPTGFASRVTSNSITISSITYNGSSSVSSGSMPNTNISMTCTNSSGASVASGSITIGSNGYTISGLSAGKYTITLVIPYAYSDPQSKVTTYATVSSEVTVPSTAGSGIPNEPDVSGFVNSDSTYAYYLTYPSGITSDTGAVVGDRITSTSTAPSGWYDYNSKNWANIVVSDTALTPGTSISRYTSTTNINVFVWIPRYEYKVDTSANSVHTIFLPGTTTSADSGYSIPDAFKFGDTQLTGFWMSKYEASDPEAEG